MNAICRTFLAAVAVGLATPASSAPPPTDGPRAVDVTPISAGAATAAPRKLAVPAAVTKITYRPPLRGAPSRRVIAGTRGGTTKQ